MQFLEYNILGRTVETCISTRESSNQRLTAAALSSQPDSAVRIPLFAKALTLLPTFAFLATCTANNVLIPTILILANGATIEIFAFKTITGLVPKAWLFTITNLFFLTFLSHLVAFALFLFAQ